MHHDPHVPTRIRRELGDLDLWQTRLVVLAFGVLSGLTVVAFTWLSEKALEWFHTVGQWSLWASLVWTPAVCALVVWITRRWFVGASGSGIPQVMAALDPRVETAQRSLFVSVRLSLAKMGLTALGLAGGLSLGREGPSVQIGAGIMHAARKWLPVRREVSDHGLLVAGGAAGIAAAFNTPLGGIMFAIEELSRRPEQRSSGLLMAAIVLAGLMGISAFGNSTYFGVIRVVPLSWSVFLPGLLVAVLCGLTGGLFARLLRLSLAGTSTDRFTRWRAAHPVRFAAGCGLAVAVLGVVTQGATFGSGYLHTKALLEGSPDSSMLYMPLKFVSTWLTAWSGVPGGIFAPSLAIGAGLGSNVADLTGNQLHVATLIALGMAGFLAAATQAPMTAFIIVMEMVDGYNLVLSLMSCALVASGVSRLVSRPLYAGLTELQILRVHPPSTASDDTPPAPSGSVPNKA